jgi:hypothetical protein
MTYTVGSKHRLGGKVLAVYNGKTTGVILVDFRKQDASYVTWVYPIDIPESTSHGKYFVVSESSPFEQCLADAKINFAARVKTELVAEAY